MPILSDAVCEAQSDINNGSIYGDWFESSYMVCAGKNGKGWYDGDFSAPLTVKNSSNNQHDLVGVTNWVVGDITGPAINECGYVSIFISVSI